MDKVITEVQGCRKAEEMKVIAYADDVILLKETEEYLRIELTNGQ